MIRRRLSGLIAAALLVGACGASGYSSASAPTLTALVTQPPGLVCMDAVTVGMLVADASTGVAFGTPGGPHGEILWPAGWSDRLDDGRIAVVDDRGAIVAHVGDTVWMGGGGPEPWAVCPPVHVVPSATPPSR